MERIVKILEQLIQDPLAFASGVMSFSAFFFALLAPPPPLFLGAIRPVFAQSSLVFV